MMEVWFRYNVVRDEERCLRETLRVRRLLGGGGGGGGGGGAGMVIRKVTLSRDVDGRGVSDLTEFRTSWIKVSLVSPCVGTGTGARVLRTFASSSISITIEDHALYTPVSQTKVISTSTVLSGARIVHLSAGRDVFPQRI